MLQHPAKPVSAPAIADCPVCCRALEGNPPPPLPPMGLKLHQHCTISATPITCTHLIHFRHVKPVTVRGYLVAGWDLAVKAAHINRCLDGQLSSTVAACPNSAAHQKQPVSTPVSTLPTLHVLQSQQPVAAAARPLWLPPPTWQSPGPSAGVMSAGMRVGNTLFHAESPTFLGASVGLGHIG